MSWWQDILDFIVALLKKHKKPKPKKTVSFVFAFGLAKPKERTPRMPVEVSITNEQKVNATLSPTTDTGKPAKLDGKPDWSVVSGESTIAVADDGMSADLVSSDNPGDTQILVKADADLGSGVEEISDMITLHVLGAMAKNLGITIGQPVPK